MLTAVQRRIETLAFELAWTPWWRPFRAADLRARLQFQFQLLGHYRAEQAREDQRRELEHFEAQADSRPREGWIRAVPGPPIGSLL